MRVGNLEKLPQGKQCSSNDELNRRLAAEITIEIEQLLYRLTKPALWFFSYCPGLVLFSREVFVFLLSIQTKPPHIPRVSPE